MKFEIGDTVAVLDENLSGIVKTINENQVEIETEDGFLLTFACKELVLLKSNISLESNIFKAVDYKKVISEKEQKKKKSSPKVKPRERQAPAMEVDLHIHHLVSSTKNMSNFDMLNLQIDTAKRKLDFAISKRIQRIVFIHGVGEGVLKLELESLFNRYDNLKYYDANYQKYGLGATEVYIYQNKIN